MRIAAILAAALALAGLATTAEARPARCTVVVEGDAWTGPCNFYPEGGGSFSLTRPGNREFPGQYSTITVQVVGGGQAEVRGLTRAGINSRLGEATRSRRQPACWDGGDFRICAY